MIANQIIQSTLDGLKAITKVDLCVMDAEGKVLASTPVDNQVEQNYQLFKVYDDHQVEYVIQVYGTTEQARMVGEIAKLQLQGLLTAYKDRFDNDNFIKNLLLDNLLLVDIYNRAKKLHIDTEVKRVIFIVEMQIGKEANTLEPVRSVLGGKSKDFITAEVLSKKGYIAPEI